MGKGALEGRLQPGWIAGWVLLLASIIPFQSWVIWLQGRCAIRAGAILKRRLLHGVTQLETDETRHLGIGGLLGTVIETESVEAFASSGGAAVLLGLVELTAAAVVLVVGLDPESLRQTLHATLERAPALLVIAHP
jgi:ATP-binding cassette, subfamily B, bacterial